MDVVKARGAPAELVLDPFAYVPDMGSKIGGLGGDARGPDGDYAFHTPYVEVAEGVAHFTVHFEQLAATQGTLNLRVHMLSDDSPHARLATAERIALNRLVLLGGHHRLRFEAFHGVRYALYGGIIGDTDARAGSVRVILDRPADPEERREIAAEARDTLYGRNAIAANHIVSLAVPTLAAPVTQAATARQMKEPAAERWLAYGSFGERDAVGRWRATYILETLGAYGMMESGARGAALGYAAGPVVAALAARGVGVDVIAAADEEHADPEAIRRALHDPALCDGAIFDRQVAARVASLQPIAPDIVNYDFIWTDGACDRLGSAEDGIRLMEAAMVCLRPGGLAVHVVDYDPASDVRGPVFERGDIERACLILISRGHDVAEFRIDATFPLLDQRGISACGIVCRKAALNA